MGSTLVKIFYFFNVPPLQIRPSSVSRPHPPAPSKRRRSSIDVFYESPHSSKSRTLSVRSPCDDISEAESSPVPPRPQWHRVRQAYEVDHAGFAPYRMEYYTHRRSLESLYHPLDCLSRQKEVSDYTLTCSYLVLDCLSRQKEVSAYTLTCSYSVLDCLSRQKEVSAFTLTCSYLVLDCLSRQKEVSAYSLTCSSLVLMISFLS